MRRQSYISMFFLGTTIYVVVFLISWSSFPTVNMMSNKLQSYYKNRLLKAATQDNQEQLTYMEEDRRKECPFPYVNPFDKAVMKYIFEYPTVDCTFKANLPSLVYLYRKVWLRVDNKKAQRLNITFQYCRYTPLKMEKGSDFNFQSYEWSDKFSEEIPLKNDDEHLYVRCYNEDIIVSRSFVSRFIKKPEIEKRAYIDYNKRVKTDAPSETLNILMIGIDGMSKQAFERSMPKTRNFLLHELKARELHKFNKVGQNTFPNVMPLLTGKHEEELLQQWSFDDYFDKIDHLFVWDEYKKAGYRTMLMTDVVRITAFHYMKMGWLKPPFDYFVRPIPAKTDREKVFEFMPEDCIGDIPEVTFLLDYVLQMTTVFNNTIAKADRRPASPYFSYNFMTRLSHDYASMSSRGDDLYLSFFQNLKESNTLHNTVLVVFSDHGGRFGKVREMYQGMLESRMPFVMFVFPQWFQEKYQNLMATFTTNQNRLTSFFDIHATLQDLLNFSSHSKIKNKGRPQRGISLLQEIPIYRNCKDAGIPLRYCLCSHVHNTQLSDTTNAVLVYTLYQHILSKTKKYRRICKQLQLKSIVSVLPMESESNEKSRSFYQTSIETTPGDALFEAIVSYDTESYVGKVEGDVVRLNLYKGQDGCMKNLKYKPFCYCRHP